MNRKYEINQQIRKAFYWLDMITVSGEAVEILAMARKELRAAQAMLPDESEAVAD